jgi:hypothetical protein
MYNYLLIGHHHLSHDTLLRGTENDDIIKCAVFLLDRRVDFEEKMQVGHSSVINHKVIFILMHKTC